MELTVVLPDSLANEAKAAGLLTADAIEKLDPTEKRRVLQLIDAFIERGQLECRASTQTA